MNKYKKENIEEAVWFIEKISEMVTDERISSMDIDYEISSKHAILVRGDTVYLEVVDNDDLIKTKIDPEEPNVLFELLK